MISHAVMAIFIAASRGDLSPTHPRSPQTPPENQSLTQECSPAPSCILSDSPLLPYFSLSLSHSHTHTHTPIIRHSDDKRRCRISSGRHLTPRSSPVVYGECGDGEEGGGSLREQPGVQKYPERGTQGEWSLWSRLCTSQADIT